MPLKYAVIVGIALTVLVLWIDYLLAIATMRVTRPKLNAKTSRQPPLHLRA
jgi:hypothetical protein